MNTSEAVAERILELCKQKNITINCLSTLSATSQSTVSDIVLGRSKNPGVVTLKKICDGLEISITEFFDTDIFRTLEQEIK